MGNGSGNFRARPVTSFSSPKDQGQTPNNRYSEIAGESANIVILVYILLNNHDLAFS